MSIAVAPKVFSLALYRPQLSGKEKPHLVGIDFEILMDRLDEHVDPVLGTLPTAKIDYGHLLTYCWRRWGFPNFGSDPYKDIAQWLLITPHRDLVLCVRPSVLPDPRFSLFFRTTAELDCACRDWEHKDVDAWTERKLDWVETQGLPEWMDEFLVSFQKHQWPAATWRDAYRGYIAMFTPREDRFSIKLRNSDEAESEHRAIMTEFAAKVAGYERIEARPAFRKRSPSIADWPTDDPMKPLALAAIEALRDLQTGVRVRDSAINAYDVTDEYEGVLAEPECAGSGIGDMINQAPQESMELYRLVLQLGSGDVKKGLSVLLKTECCANSVVHSKRASQ